MRALIVGGSGHLGSQLARCARAAGHQVAVTYRTRPPRNPDTGAHQLDLRDQDQTTALIGRLKPELIINTAFQQDDWASSAVAPANLATAVADRSSRSIRLVHVSSDAVFSGEDIHYDETALPDPITPYGAAKAAAETAIAAICPTAVIARTSLIIGHQSTHERFVHALATGRQDGTLFTDDYRCPVHVDDLAAALLELGASIRSGIHHNAGAEAISRYQLGILIARRDGPPAEALRLGLRADTKIPGPLDVRLDSTQTQQVLRTRLRGASEFLVPGRD